MDLILTPANAAAKLYDCEDSVGEHMAGEWPILVKVCENSPAVVIVRKLAHDPSSILQQTAPVE